MRAYMDLLAYGQHFAGCQKRVVLAGRQQQRTGLDCSCGLDKALALASLPPDDLEPAGPRALDVAMLRRVFDRLGLGIHTAYGDDFDPWAAIATDYAALVATYCSHGRLLTAECPACFADAEEST